MMEFLCSGIREFFSYVDNVLAVFHGFLLKNGFYGSFIAALAVAAILFFIKEIFDFSKIVNGDFYLLSETKRSAYNPYFGLIVERKFVVYSDGHSVRGSCEKIREKEVGKPAFEYRAADRVRGVVNGYIERKYFGPSRLHLHIVENNKKSRKSTSYVTVNLGWKIRGRNFLKGEFYSTAAESVGSVKICKTKPELLSI